MNYKVVPFNQSTSTSQDLQRILDENSADGWKYENHMYNDYLKPGSSGCFGIGARADQIWHVGHVVFSKA